MEVTLKVKDFIIDKDEIVTQEKQTKAKRKISTEYSLVLENNIDFVLNKKTATTNKDLVFLVSQGLFYFKHKNGKIEEINDSKLKSFFQQFSNKDQMFTKLGWWKDRMDDNLSKLRTLMYSKELREFYKHNIFISYDQSKQWHHYMEKNSKLFLYAYQKIQSMGSRVGSKEAIYSNIFDIESKIDFNNAIYFIDKLSESEMATGYLEGWNSRLKMTQMISTYNLNCNRFFDYIVQDLYAQGIITLNYDLLRLYDDYLHMQVSLYGQVKEKYPKYLKTEHDKVALKLNIYNKYHKDLVLLNITEANKKLAYKNDKYCIILPTCATDIVDEGINQSNCVGGYVDRIVNGNCVVLFMRDINNKDESLVTVEVCGNQITQAKGFANRRLYGHEEDFIKEWAEKKKLEIVGY